MKVYIILLCSLTNPIFWKNLTPEILVKMHLANQFAGFLNQPYLQNKLMKWLTFLHVLIMLKIKCSLKLC